MGISEGGSPREAAAAPCAPTGENQRSRHAMAVVPVVLRVVVVPSGAIRATMVGTALKSPRGVRRAHTRTILTSDVEV